MGNGPEIYQVLDQTFRDFVDLVSLLKFQRLFSQPHVGRVFVSLPPSVASGEQLDLFGDLFPLVGPFDENFLDQTEFVASIEFIKKKPNSLSILVHAVADVVHLLDDSLFRESRVDFDVVESLLKDLSAHVLNQVGFPDSCLALENDGNVAKHPQADKEHF